MDLDITQEQLDEWELNRKLHIQHAFPHLTASEREFILTGATDDDWAKLFPPDEEEA